MKLKALTSGCSVARGLLWGVGLLWVQSWMTGAAVAAPVGGNVPWPSAHGENPPPPPDFLDITDRRIRDERQAPGAQRVDALLRLEQEALEYLDAGQAYEQTVHALVQHEYARQWVDRNERYRALIQAEEKEEDQSRLEAIAEFEAFLRKYPDDATYSADAMFRLGELYYERDAILQQQAMNAYLEAREQARGGTPAVAEPKKSFRATIDVYRQLIARFPEYERLDGVYYLVGYCLNEMGRMDEARVAWLNLVCANHYEYEGELASAAATGPEAPGLSGDLALGEPMMSELSEDHPAMTMDHGRRKRRRKMQRSEQDPYGDCEPAVPGSRFFAETWLRIGEYHFDLDYTAAGLARAISAYKNVLAREDDRNYNLALYKVAWAYYRASRYPEAVEHFWQLIQWSDDERRRTGRQGSELREEAVQYLGIAFAYDDWNENQVRDEYEGGKTPLERVQDAKLMPQDRRWTSEVYHRLGSVLFDEAKYPEAIAIWEAALRKWPLHPEAPAIQHEISRAYAMHNEPELAAEARSGLSRFREGSAWWRANEDHPAEQRDAQRLAEDALVQSAVNQHQQAQSLRRRCVEQTRLALCAEAQKLYGVAAHAYREYIRAYPNSPEAYELHFNLAEALYWSENYDEAAEEYAKVRDSNLDDRYLSTAARQVVESIKRMVDAQRKAGTLVDREQPPEPSGSPVAIEPVPMPEPLQRLARARELYLARVAPDQDTEQLREAYAYNNTLLLYAYGYWDLARERFYAIYADHCSGPTASEAGQVAWINLRNIAVTLNQTAEVRRLGADLETRGCTFAASTPAGGVDCQDPQFRDHPACLAGADLTNLRYQDAVEIYQRAELAEGDERRRLFEQAATELVRAVNDEPEHPQAPLALEKAAIALEQTGRFESAARLYQRILDEVGPRRASSSQEQTQLDAITANAYFRLAYNANRFFDYERAVANYRVLADSRRFVNAEQTPAMTEWREGALINAAKILEYQQKYDDAAVYYRRAAESLQDPQEARAARFRAAEMSYKLGRWPETQQQMRAFINRYRNDTGAAELIVQAHWRIAEALKARRRSTEHRQALEQVVQAYAASQLPPGSYAASFAAQAHFALADQGTEAFEDFAIRLRRPATLDAYVNKVGGQITAGANEAKERAAAYQPIPAYNRPEWTVAALVRQGRIYEILARAVLNTPFVVPADLNRKMRGLPEDSKDEIRFQVEDRVRQLLDERVRPIECLAVARYALASRAARAGSIDTELARVASDRINAYGDERIAECVAQAAQQDATFRAYQPGEFARAPRGQTMEIPANVAPPALGGGAQ